MKTFTALLIGVAAGVALSQTAANLTATLASNTTSNTTATAPAAPPAVRGAGRGGAGGGGSNVHPVSKNITERLTKSPRHQEFVKIQQGDRSINTFVVYPSAKEKVGVVVLIHEIFGLSDWVKAAADEMAEKGYIVLVPDLLSGMGPNKGGTESYADAQVTGAVSGLPAQQVLDDLNAVVTYGKKIDSADGNVSVAGFCWGGGKAFALATANKDIKAAFVYYGAVPPVADMAKISAPVYAFFGENDARTALPGMSAADPMKAAGKAYDPITYAGAAHGFMRTGQMDNTNDADKKAAADAWSRMLAALAKVEGKPAPAAAGNTTAAPMSAPAAGNATAAPARGM